MSRNILLLSSLALIIFGCMRIDLSYSDETTSSGTSTASSSGGSKTSNATSLESMNGTMEASNTLTDSPSGNSHITTLTEETLEPTSSQTQSTLETTDSEADTTDSTATTSTESGGPSNPECGNGILEEDHGSPTEQCDDGNKENDDACSDSCQKNGRLVFISSRIFNGNIEIEESLFPLGKDPNPKSGLDDANMHCWDMALRARESGVLAWSVPQADKSDRRFKAWLSRNSLDSDGGSWPTNFPNGFMSCSPDEPSAPLFLSNGDKLADSFEDLIGLTPPKDDGPNLQINIDETGETHNQARVWTNTKIDGDLGWDIGDCNEWTEAIFTPLGWSGKVDTTENNKPHLEWTTSATTFCFEHLRIYCFEQCPSPA